MDTAGHTHITGEQRTAATAAVSTVTPSATTSGSTCESVEEEKLRTPLRGVIYEGSKYQHTRQRRSIAVYTTAKLSFNLSSHPSYCYHTDDTDTHTPHICATKLVASGVAVEDRGGTV